jgi:hypothetical protein
MLSWNVCNHQSTMRNLPEERISQVVNILYFSRACYAIRPPHSTQFYLSNIGWIISTKNPLSMQLYPAIRYLLDPTSHILGLFCPRSVARFLDLTSWIATSNLSIVLHANKFPKTSTYHRHYPHVTFNEPYTVWAHIHQTWTIANAWWLPPNNAVL